MVTGQRNVDNDKTNEILTFAPLLAPLNLAGRVVTADAMHTQKKAARLAVRKGGHYIFGVKENQPKLWNAAVGAADGIDLDLPEYEISERTHGRIDRHRVHSASTIWHRLPSREDLRHRRARIVDSR
jgi:predicted transposase YbfD/YdcC